MDLKTRIIIFAYLKNLKAPSQTHFLKHYLGLGFALLGGVIAVALFVQLSVLRPTTDNME